MEQGRRNRGRRLEGWRGRESKIESGGWRERGREGGTMEGGSKGRWEGGTREGGSKGRREGEWRGRVRADIETEGVTKTNLNLVIAEFILEIPYALFFTRERQPVNSKHLNLVCIELIIWNTQTNESHTTIIVYWFL